MPWRALNPPLYFTCVFSVTAVKNFSPNEIKSTGRPNIQEHERKSTYIYLQHMFYVFYTLYSFFQLVCCTFCSAYSHRFLTFWTPSRQHFTQSNHLTQLSMIVCKNLQSGLERNQSWCHFFMPFCVFFLWPLLVLVTSDFTNIQNNLMWMGKMQYYTNSNLVMFL